MKKENVKKIILASLLYGSLWGLAEAVLGYILHLLPIGISGFIMFPVGFYFMNNVYKQTQKTSSIFYVAIVAASIKLVDLFIPFLPVIKIVNPAVCILAESMLVAVFYKMLISEKKGLNFIGAVLASMAWRTFFVAYMFVLTFFSIPSGLLKGGYMSVANFILFEGIFNTAIIYLYVRLDKMEKMPVFFSKLKIKPLTSILIFTAALAATFCFSII